MAIGSTEAFDVAVQGTEAYDLALFAPREPKLREVTEKAARGKAKGRTKLQSLIMAGAAMLAAATLALVLGFGIFMKVQIAETGDRIADMKEELRIQESEKARLEGMLKEQTTAAQVEEYARANGMRPLEAYQIRYITVENGDRVEVAPERERTLWEKLFGG